MLVLTQHVPQKKRHGCFHLTQPQKRQYLVPEQSLVSVDSILLLLMPATTQIFILLLTDTAALTVNLKLNFLLKQSTTDNNNTHLTALCPVPER